MANGGHAVVGSWNRRGSRLEASSSAMFSRSGNAEGMHYLEGKDWSEILKIMIIQDDNKSNDEAEAEEEEQSRMMMIVDDEHGDKDHVHDHVHDQVHVHDHVHVHDEVEERCTGGRKTPSKPGGIQRAQSERPAAVSERHQPRQTRWSVTPKRYGESRVENDPPTRTGFSANLNQCDESRGEIYQPAEVNRPIVSQKIYENREENYRPTRSRWSVIQQQYGKIREENNRLTRSRSYVIPQQYDEIAGKRCRPMRTRWSVTQQHHDESTGTNYRPTRNRWSIIQQQFDDGARKTYRPTRTLSTVITPQLSDRNCGDIFRSLSLDRSAARQLEETNERSGESAEVRVRGNSSSRQTDGIDGDNEEISQRTRNSTHICQICFSSVDVLVPRSCCSFPICQSCFGKYLATQIDDGKIRITCPNYDCRSTVQSDEIDEVVDAERRTKLERLAAKSLRKKGFKACPQCNAITVASETLLSKAKQERSTFKVTCPVCELDWCYDCETPWHRRSTCQSVKSNDKLFKEWTKRYSGSDKNARRCPKCKVYIQKDTGCDKMTCRRCLTTFCYKCGRRISSSTHHCYNLFPHISSDPGTIFLMVLLAPLAIPAIIAVAVVALPVIIGYGGYKLVKAVRKRPTQRIDRDDLQ